MYGEGAFIFITCAEISLFSKRESESAAESAWKQSYTGMRANGMRITFALSNITVPIINPWMKCPREEKCRSSVNIIIVILLYRDIARLKMARDVKWIIEWNIILSSAPQIEIITYWPTIRMLYRLIQWNHNCAYIKKENVIRNLVLPDWCSIWQSWKHISLPEKAIKKSTINTNREYRPEMTAVILW